MHHKSMAQGAFIILLGMMLFLSSKGWCGPEVTPEQAQQIEEQGEAGGISPELIQKGKAILEQEGDLAEGIREVVEAKPDLGKQDDLEEEKKKVLPPQEEDYPGAGRLPSFFKGSPFFRFVQSRLAPAEDVAPPYPYGYRFFFGKPPAAIPPASLVSEDYVLAPGDEIQVLLYGKTNVLHRLSVQEDGSILFPKIGPVFIAGLTYGDVKKTLKDWIPKKMLGVQVHVTLSRLRSVPVTMVGEIKRPGLLQVSPMATLTEAIALGGGPLANGSLRNIQIVRPGGKVIRFDFYRFLEGKGEDPMLEPKDLIRIPLTGAQSAVIGQVKRPGIYELSNRDKRLEDVLRLAGGIVPQADKQRLQVERLQDNHYREVLDIDLAEMPRHFAFPIQDWDIITVRSLPPGFNNVVYLKGHIRHPGAYELRPGMRVSDLVKGPEELKKDVYLDYALIKRRQPPGWKLQLLPFDLGRAVVDQDPEANMQLQARDEVYVFSRWMFEPRYQVEVLGEVQKPGKIAWVHDMRVKDALLEAGGLTQNAFLSKGGLLRRETSGKWQRITFDVAKAIDDDPANNIMLQPLDQLTIHSLSEMAPSRKVNIRGEVYRPGDYLLSENMRIADLVFAAGGITPKAYAEQAELARKEIRDGQAVRTITRDINIALALEGDETHNILLQPLDNLYVRPVTGYDKTLECNILGEVKFPGKYVIEPGERLSSLISRAGGFTEYAYLKGSVFQREAIRKSNDRILKNLVKRLEMDLAQSELDPSRIAKSEEKAMASLAVKRRLLDRLRKVEVPGRMIVKLEPLPDFIGGPYDIALEDGDSLLVPSRPNSVSVIGDVYNPTAMLWEADLTFEDYLKMCGGPTRTADKDAIYLVKANGIVKTDEGGLLNSLFSQKLEPGDTIVVPEEIDTGAMETWKDATQIAYQIAVSVAAVSYIFKQ
ncbi:MAG: SLBB domain-containing protein [Deltaproteobacteria bacterium]|nr:SLBB domain-containing protein [Deltaproteobacteria bacterium]